MNDEWDIALDDEAMERARDKYIQDIIELLDDPDYDGIPVLIDGENIIYPRGGNIVKIIKALKATTKWFKKQLFKEEE